MDGGSDNCSGGNSCSHSDFATWLTLRSVTITMSVDGIVR